jgi:hypothetical protein
MCKFPQAEYRGSTRTLDPEVIEIGKFLQSQTSNLRVRVAFQTRTRTRTRSLNPDPEVKNSKRLENNSVEISDSSTEGGVVVSCFSTDTVVFYSLNWKSNRF